MKPKQTQNKAKSATKKKAKKKFNYKILLFGLWFFFLVSIGLVVSVFYAAKNGYLGEMPNVRDLENPDINVASQIISSDGKLIGTFETEKRDPITYQDLPPHLVDALLAKEDERFFDHPGIDAEALARVVKGFVTNQSLGGGSTITQQLAKQLFTKNVSRKPIERAKQKIKEWVVAVQLERLYSKKEIIALYFNKFDFTYQAKGIELASKVYFNTTTKDLTVDQSATLVAMFRNPNLYNPIRNPERSLQKRNLVIDKMVELGKISTSEGEMYKAKPLGVDRQRLSDTYESFSGYFKHALKKDLTKYLKEYEDKYGKKYDIYKDGLKIYVTLDSRMQEKAEAAVEKHLVKLQRMFFRSKRGQKRAPFRNISMAKRERIFQAAMRRTELYKILKEKGMSDDEILEEFNKPRDSVQYFTWKGVEHRKDVSLMDSIIYHKHILQSGMMSMDPKDGTIKAWVGGIDWDYFKYDHVRQARRQVGSTFKPLVYATAINQMNYTPCHTVSNTTFRLPGWKVLGGGGSLSLRDALAHSKNPVAARLISRTGVQNVKKMARDVGIYNPIKDDFTISLGSSDLTVYEMVGALSTFANGGIFVKPELILRIEDESGKVIKEYAPETREVVNEYVAYTMIDIMKGVTTYGTAKKLRGYGVGNAQIAGKTGTTNDNSDGWFIGLTPNLVTGVWVGAEDRFASFASGAIGQGAYLAMPIFGHYMRSVYAEGKKFGVTKSDKFEKPDDIDEKWDCGSKTGFHNYGDLGGIYRDFQETETTTVQATVQDISVNDAGNQDDVEDWSGGDESVPEEDAPEPQPEEEIDQ